jgi:hypothetical protein
MDPQNGTARFDIEFGASPANLREVFHRIGDYCRRTAAHAVIVRVAGYVAVSSEQLHFAKLAWVMAHREMFAALVQTEYPAIRSGITARAFLAESSALRWLSW